MIESDQNLINLRSTEEYQILKKNFIKKIDGLIVEKSSKVLDFYAVNFEKDARYSNLLSKKDHKDIDNIDKKGDPRKFEKIVGLYEVSKTRSQENQGLEKKINPKTLRKISYVCFGLFFLIIPLGLGICIHFLSKSREKALIQLDNDRNLVGHFNNSEAFKEYQRLRGMSEDIDGSIDRIINKNIKFAEDYKKELKEEIIYLKSFMALINLNKDNALEGKIINVVRNSGENNYLIELNNCVKANFSKKNIAIEGVTDSFKINIEYSQSVKQLSKNVEKGLLNFQAEIFNKIRDKEKEIKNMEGRKAFLFAKGEKVGPIVHFMRMTEGFGKELYEECQQLMQEKEKLWNEIRKSMPEKVEKTARALRPVKAEDFEQPLIS